MNRLVYVSGRGAVTPFGTGVVVLIEGIFSARSAIAKRRRLESVRCHSAVAAELPEAVVAAAGGSKDDLAFAIAFLAAREAIEDAGITDRRPLGLVLATTKADMSGIVGAGDGLGIPSRLQVRLSKALGIDGLRAAVSCACASGLAALSHAARWIAVGAVDEVVVVGVDVLNEFIVTGFSSLLALAPGPCRPFDADRCGLTLGEGAGALVLSAAEPRRRTAIVSGWGASNDAQHLTAPQRDGNGLLAAAERALRLAGLLPERIGYVHLHGTGSVYNDAMEAKAMTRLFAGRTPPASGTKAQTGHMLGAAGIVESIIAVEAMRRGAAPANVGLTNSGVDAGLDVGAAPKPIPRDRAILKLAAGFGGINAAMVFAP